LANDLLWESSPEPLGDYRSGRPGPSAAAAPEVSAVVDALRAAARPVIVAGQGVLYGEAWDELRELAELAAIPVATTLNGKSAFSENHRLALGTMGRSRPVTVDRFFDEADLILGIGTSFTRSEYLRPLPDEARLAQITNDVRGVGRSYDVSLVCLGDAKLTIRQIVEELHRRGPGDSVGERDSEV